MILLQFKPKIALSEQKNCNKFCNFLPSYKLFIFKESSGKVERSYKEFNERSEIEIYLMSERGWKVGELKKLWKGDGCMSRKNEMYFCFEG